MTPPTQPPEPSESSEPPPPEVPPESSSGKPLASTTRPSFPFSTSSGDVVGDDADQQDLPPGMVLPDAADFRKGQLLARLIVAIVSLIVLIVFLLIFPDEGRIIGLCVGLVAGVVMVLFVRYRRACRDVQQQRPIEQSNSSKTA